MDRPIRAGLRACTTAIVVLLITSAVPTGQAQNRPRITSPKDQFGWEIGDDYRLVN